MTRNYVRVGLAVCSLVLLSCNTFDSPSHGDVAFTPPSVDIPPSIPTPPPPFGFAGRGSSFPGIAGSAGAPVPGGFAGTVSAAGSGGQNGWQFLDAGTVDAGKVDAGTADDAGADDAGR